VRARLALTAAAVTTMIVLAFCIPLGRLIQVVANNRALDAAKLESRSLAGAISAVPGQTATVTQLVEQANAGSPRPITVYLPDGTVLGPPVPVDAEVELARRGRSFTAAGPDGGRDILVGIAGPDAQATTVVRVRVAASLLSRGVERAWAIVAAIGALVVVVAVALADRLALSIVRPMGELFSVTRRLQRGELQARVSPAGPPEVAEVGLAVNGLADRIGDLLAAERERAADLSHQLRTPLTVLRLDSEGLASPEDRRRIAGDVDRLEQVVTRTIEESRNSPRQATGDRRGAATWARWSVSGWPSGRSLPAARAASGRWRCPPAGSRWACRRGAGGVPRRPAQQRAGPHPGRVVVLGRGDPRGRTANGRWSSRTPARGCPETCCRRAAQVAAQAPAWDWTSCAGPRRYPAAVSPPGGRHGVEPASRCGSARRPLRTVPAGVVADRRRSTGSARRSTQP